MSRPTPPITDEERHAAVETEYRLRRRLQYNIWLTGLTPYQVERLCHSRCPCERDRSFEEFLNEQYETGAIEFRQLDEALADLTGMAVR